MSSYRGTEPEAESHKLVDRAQGIDVSRWQGAVDWAAVRDAGYRFAFVRATIGDYYVDPQFDRNWQGAVDAGILVSAYHVIAPNKPADSQVAHFFDVLEGRSPALPLVVDAEREDGAAPSEISRCTLACLEGVQQREGRRPIIYTARWYWNRQIQSSQQWASHDLWLASYTSEPVLPRDWTTWRFWQYTERGRVPGIRTGTDLNWFHGTYDDLLAYASSEGEAPEATKPRWRVRVTTSKLNIRSGPGLKFDDLGDLYEGDELDVLTLTGDDAWVEFQPGRWAALALDGECYLEPAPEEPKSDDTEI